MEITTCKNCGISFPVRKADLKRGWGLFCGKRCKAIEQERRTGQYSRFKLANNEHNLGSDWDEALHPLSGDGIGQTGGD